MIVEDVTTTPVVVVGGGIAGLATALSLDACVVVSQEPIGNGASRLAQGGIAAALGHGDAPALHAADTLHVSTQLADPAIVALVTSSAAGRVKWLQSLGVAFDRSPSGELALGREAGHGRDRIVHAGGDRTGNAVMQALREAVGRRPDIRVLESWELVDLITADDRAAGALFESGDGSRVAVLAPNVVLATGGIGGCFDRTTNPAASRGAGLAVAARQGVQLADLEFVQFHPTALAVDSDPLPLLTEALRGAGAALVDDSGHRFMPAMHPDAELAPRDVVARSVYARTVTGRQVLLDATGIGNLAARFPGACALAKDAGFDATRQPLPVVAAAHFHMGGIATDAHGATSMPGLWACGEVAATGLHGGNRLASNSLLEGLVFGGRIARAIGAANLAPAAGPLLVPRSPPLSAPDSERIMYLRRLVGRSLGPLRSGQAMLAASRRLDAWQPASRIEHDLAAVVGLSLRAALARRESRGAHQRVDHPQAGTGPAARSFLSPRPGPVMALHQRRSRVA
jgi:L-aspartate oxidase